MPRRLGEADESIVEFFSAMFMSQLDNDFYFQRFRRSQIDKQRQGECYHISLTTRRRRLHNIIIFYPYQMLFLLNMCLALSLLIFTVWNEGFRFVHFQMFNLN